MIQFDSVMRPRSSIWGVIQVPELQLQLHSCNLRIHHHGSYCGQQLSICLCGGSCFAVVHKHNFTKRMCLLLYLLLDAELQSTSKSGSASTASVFSDKLPRHDSKIHDPFDDDFDIEDGIVSQSNASSQITASTSSSFDDLLPVSVSQSQCSLAFSAGN